MIPLLLSCAVLLPQQPPVRALEIVSLQRGAARLRHHCPPFGSLLVAPDQAHEHRRDLLDAGVGGELRRDALPERWLEIAHGAARAEERLSWNTGDARLFVEAEPRLLPQVLGELRALRAVVDRPIEVTVELFECTDESAVAVVLQPGEAGRGRGPLLWRSRAHLRNGEAATFDGQRWSRYVRAANVEVAQDAAVSNPVLASFAEGLAAAVGAHAVADSDDLVLFVQFACGQKRRLDTAATGVAGQPTLDQPLLETAFGTAAGRVHGGGALQLVFGGHALGGSRGVLVISAQGEPRPTAHVGETLLLPVSALTSRAMTGRIELPDPNPQLGDEHPLACVPEDHSEGLLGEGALECARRAAGEGATVEFVRGHLLVHGPAATRAAVTAAVREIGDRMLRTMTARCAVDVDDVAGAAPFAAPTGKGPALRLHQVAVPMLPGRSAFVFRGLEWTAIRTMLPEIAQEATITVPIVETRQSGVWLYAAVPFGETNGFLELEAQFAHSSAPQLRSLGADGALQLADDCNLRTPRVSMLPFDQDVELGHGSTLGLDGRWVRPRLVAHIGTGAGGK